MTTKQAQQLAATAATTTTATTAYNAVVTMKGFLEALQGWGVLHALSRMEALDSENLLTTALRAVISTASFHVTWWRGELRLTVALPSTRAALAALESGGEFTTVTGEHIPRGATSWDEKVEVEFQLHLDDSKRGRQQPPSVEAWETFSHAITALEGNFESYNERERRFTAAVEEVMRG